VRLSSAKLIDYLDRVRSTYWFLPLIMTIISIILAILLLKANQQISNASLENKVYIYHINPSSVHSILLNIASTSLGVIGIVFSITLVPLTIAASQYGPILIRSFLRDTTTQVVLGTYCATIGFCTATLISLPSDLNSENVPLISVTIAVWMLLISLVMLLFFFHHVAEGLQASRIIANVGNEIEKEIRYERKSFGSNSQYNEAHGEDEDAARSTIMQQGKAVPASKSGYVRAIDFDSLLKIAEKNDMTFLIKRITGDFIIYGDSLLLAWPASESNELFEAVNNSYMLGENRTIQQDVEYGMTSLVIIASRALSPAINDPVTPAMCLNRLGAALCMLADKEVPSSCYYDNAGKLRIIADPVSFERMAGVSFNLIRQYGRNNADVLISMLRTIATVAAHACTRANRDILLQHAKLIMKDGNDALLSPYDKERVCKVYDEAMKAADIQESNSAIFHEKRINN
jgi:uncharacterized membrane protein